MENKIKNKLQSCSNKIAVSDGRIKLQPWLRSSK